MADHTPDVSAPQFLTRHALEAEVKYQRAEVERFRSVQIVTVQTPDGSPCAAPCAIEGCQYSEVERLRAENEQLATAAINWSKGCEEWSLKAVAAEAERDQLRQLVQRLVDAVSHLEICAICAEDELAACYRGGREAAQARDDASAFLAGSSPTPQCEATTIRTIAEAVGLPHDVARCRLPRGHAGKHEAESPATEKP